MAVRTFHTTRLPYPSESSGFILQVAVHTAVRLRGLQRRGKLVCSLPQKRRVPDLVCRDTLPGAYGCPVLLQLLQNNLRRCEVLRNLSQCTWISTLLDFSLCLPSGQT